MKRLIKCPCGLSSCPQLALVHDEINRNYKSLKRFSLSVTQEDLLADDLLQHFCLNLIKRPHNFIPGTSFIALGRVSIKRLYLNSLRDKRILTPANSQNTEKVLKAVERGGESTEPCSSYGTYKDVEFRDLIEAICRIFNSQAERTTFIMLFEGDSGREIAEHLNMNVNTVHGMIRRIRKAVLAEFSDLDAL